MDGNKPIAHLDMAVLENSTDLDRKLFAAGVAFVEANAIALALERAGLIKHAAVRTYAPVGPKPRLHESISVGFVVEVRGGKNGTGHGKISLCRNSISSTWSRQVQYRLLFVRFGTFQWVTAIPNRKFAPRSSPRRRAPREARGSSWRSDHGSTISDFHKGFVSLSTEISVVFRTQSPLRLDCPKRSLALA